MRCVSKDLSVLPATQHTPQGLASRILTFRFTQDFEEAGAGNGEKNKEK